MSAFGIALVAAVVALAGAWRHPAGRPARLWPVCVLAVAAACAVKFAGNLRGLYADGQVLEWCAVVVAAIAATALSVPLFAKR
jgi:hypothetical protein